MTTKTTKGETTIELKPITFKTLSIPIVGTSPLIVHRWSEKAKAMILEKQMGKSRGKKEAKNPEEDYESSMYRTSNGKHGFPASGFKAAIVSAGRLFDGVTMALLKQVIRVEIDQEDLVIIEGTPRMREDMVRLETKVADIRYRAEYPEWRAMLRVTFPSNVVSSEQIINLVDAAGFGGIGEWRPSAPKSSSGSFGCFKVDPGENIAETTI